MTASELVASGLILWMVLIFLILAAWNRFYVPLEDEPTGFLAHARKLVEAEMSKNFKEGAK